MENARGQLLESLTIDLKRNEKLNWHLFVPAILLLIWVILLFLSPLLIAPNTIYLGNNGKVSVMDNESYINSHIHNPIFRAVYLVGDFMCHQHADRSFFINGNQMPFCARCTGIFLGMAFGAFVGSFFRVRIGLGLYILIILPMGIDGVLQLLTPYESTNLIRIITGMLVGTFTSMVFYYIYYDSRESSQR